MKRGTGGEHNDGGPLNGRMGRESGAVPECIAIERNRDRGDPLYGSLYPLGILVHAIMLQNRSLNPKVVCRSQTTAPRASNGAVRTRRVLISLSDDRRYGIWSRRFAYPLLTRSGNALQGAAVQNQVQVSGTAGCHLHTCPFRRK